MEHNLESMHCYISFIDRPSPPLRDGVSEDPAYTGRPLQLKLHKHGAVLLQIFTVGSGTHL